MARIKLLIVLFLLLPVVAFGAPTISDVSGVVVHGDTIVITSGDSDFTTKATAAPIRFETFEVKDGGGLPTLGETIPDEIAWWTGRGGSINGHPRDPVVSETKLRSSFSERVAATYLERIDDVVTVSQVAWKNEVGWTSTGKVYINLWVYWKWAVNPEYNVGGDLYQIKAFDVPVNILSNSGIEAPNLTSWDSWLYDGAYTQSNNRNQRLTHSDNNLYYSNDTLPEEIDGWVNVILLSEPGTNDDTGATEDGWRISEISNWNFSAAYQVVSQTDTNFLDDETWGVYPIDSFKFGWYIGTNLKTGNVTLYWDDIYFDNVFNRVEIGDAAVYANCQHREIQIPTVWTTNSIEVTINQGSFENLETFLFVVDSNNTPSDGYALTIGDETTVILEAGATMTTVVGDTVTFEEN